LLVYLQDEKIKIYRETTSSVGGTSAESAGGSAKVDEVLKGDGRLAAAEALGFVGARRYGKRADIMKQLRFLATGAAIDPPLKKKAAELVDAVLP
jgi:hypothetical protein